MNRRVLRPVGLVVVTLAPTLVFSQSLADTAKAEQVRRKKSAPADAAKVYTESDLPASPAKPSPDPDAGKTAGKTAAKKSATGRLTAEEMKQIEIASFKEGEARYKARIAEIDAEVQRLAKHPTGGGKVCRIPEGVFVPGVTAPSQVVCPYQMESRYDEAKRHLEEAKRDLAAYQDDARRRGISL